MSVKRVIYGNVPAKANAYRIGNGRFYKADSIKKYEADFARQWVRTTTIEGEFELNIKVYFKSNASDLDNALKGTLDNLQRVGAIRNDRNCMKIIAEKRIDKVDPRIELIIKSL